MVISLFCFWSSSERNEPTLVWTYPVFTWDTPGIYYLVLYIDWCNIFGYHQPHPCMDPPWTHGQHSYLEVHSYLWTHLRGLFQGVCVFSFCDLHVLIEQAGCVAEPALPRLSLSCANPQLGTVGYERSSCKREFWLFWPRRAHLCFTGSDWHWSHLRQGSKWGREDVPCTVPRTTQGDSAHRVFIFIYSTSFPFPCFAAVELQFREAACALCCCWAKLALGQKNKFWLLVISASQWM